MAFKNDSQGPRHIHECEDCQIRHTQTPWRIGDAGHTVFGPPNGNPSPETVGTVTNKTNAAFIVRAVNAHEEMVSLLKEIHCLYKELNISEYLDKQIERIIEKAEGEQHGNA